MDWKLIWCTRHEILDVPMSIPQDQIRNIQIFTKKKQNIILL